MKDKQAKYPQLRFKGFTDPWVQRNLSDLATFSKGKGYSKSDLVSDGFPAILYGRMYTNYESQIDDISDTFVADATDAVLSQTGDVIVPGSGETPEDIVRASNVNVSGIVLGGDINIIRPDTEKMDSTFLALTISNGQQQTELIKRAQGKSVVHLHNSDLKKVNVVAPLKDEQSAISSLFTQLDNLIAANQRKLDLLKEQKKGYLQKMFPKNGAKVPELRFAGFADDWEERKLSDLFIKGGSGGTPKSTNKAFYDGDIPFLSISDITKSNGFINNTEKHISSDGLNSSAAWIVSKGAISLAMYASVGKLAILNIDAATSQAFYNMIFDDYDLRDLVYQRLNKANELSEWNKLISTGTQSNLNADKVKNFQMYLPKNHDEIKLISTFFQQLDNTIALHQRKLDLLKEQKKGFLQNMFV